MITSTNCTPLFLDFHHRSCLKAASRAIDSKASNAAFDAAAEPLCRLEIHHLDITPVDFEDNVFREDLAYGESTKHKEDQLHQTTI